ncbi:tRNA (cytosine-5-)-methyltransferase-like [Hibiscus syriacus]|uniref:tRNA (Cytosine-5-)-methyltransferase-like n=1 Tax=Hibiscus syriacus TaxID=106335 RepID=A0A6A2Z552_HIBSY|nr:tRNA (cytosine-5-)-methyltransferase-like [Hibiscus syriacus]
MKSPLKNLSSIPPFLLRYFSSPKHLCSHPQTPIPHTPNPTATISPEKITSDSHPTSKQPFSDSENPHLPSSSSEDTSLTQTHVINTLLSHKNDSVSALKYFRSIEKKRCFVDSIDGLCVLLHILVGSSQTHKHAQYLLNNNFGSDHSGPAPFVFLDHLVDTSKRFDFELNSRAFNYLLNSYVRVNRFDDAVDCFNGMLERDIVPWIPYMNILLTALVRRSLMDKARELYGKMVSIGVRGDCFTVYAMMRAFLKEGKPWEGEEFFREAKTQGIDLDAAVYRISIHVACRKPDLNMSTELLRKMEGRGWVPSESSYTTVIGAFIKQGNLAEALRLKDEMLSSGKPLNLVAATSLMKGYCKQGDIDQALDLFNKIKDDGLAPNKVTYTVLI